MRLALRQLGKEEHPVVFFAVQGQVTPSVPNESHPMKKERFIEPKIDPSNYRYNFFTSRKNINYERDYYLPPSTPSTTEQVTNARAKKIFILKYRIGRLFGRTVCKSRMI